MNDPDDAALVAAMEVIEAEIVEYIGRNPNAADTCEGIALWWLVLGSEVAPVVVGAVLESLVRSGVLESRHLPSGEFLYRAARH